MTSKQEKSYGTTHAHKSALNPHTATIQAQSAALQMEKSTLAAVNTRHHNLSGAVQTYVA
jgi:hypothetical protein